VRIAVVSRWYPLPGHGHAGLFVREQVDALSADHDVSVLVPAAAPAAQVARFLTARGLLEREAAVPLPERVPAGVLLRALVLDRALSRGPGRPPELVHVHLLAPDALPTLLACRRRRIPLVVTEHAGYLPELVRRHRRARLQVRFVLRYGQAVVAVGSALARAIETIEPAARVEVVGNAIDTAWFTPALSPTRDHALTVATTLDEEKGIDLLLRAWAGLANTGVPRLVVVGEDPGKRFARLAAALGVGEHVQFPGVVPRDELRRLMQHAAFYVCASRAETFGVAVAEALACGKPVVSTRCGGPEDFVSDQVGLTVPVDDEQALARAVGALAATASAYDPAVLHAHIEGLVGHDAFRRRMNVVYESALQR
jgi:glycosyltransferase involved in cell wall biosynthesis